MPEPAPNPELMRSLGRLVRGLSALFWGLPTALVVCFYTARTDGWKTFGVIPPLVATALLAYGLWLMSDFQKQERVWRHALDRARVLSLVNVGLSPFLYWWYRVPSNFFFLAMVSIMTVSSLLFLASLNVSLQRLGAMLPDEALRQEIHQFTGLNLALLLVTALLAVVYAGLLRVPQPPYWLLRLLAVLDHGSFWLLVLLVLLPLAMTMALLWKIKEVILDSVFGGRHY